VWSSEAARRRPDRADRPCLFPIADFEALFTWAAARGRALPEGPSTRPHRATIVADRGGTPGNADRLSVIVAVQRGQLDPSILRDLDDDAPVSIAAMTASELLHGAHRLTDAVAGTRAERFVEQMLDAIPVVASISTSPACTRVSARNSRPRESLWATRT
jgi:hypothetical protein